MAALRVFGSGPGRIDNIADRSFAVSVDPTPTAGGGEFLVNSETNNVQDLSSITALTGGGFVVTWTSFAQDGSYGGIYGQRFDAAGTPVDSEFRNNSTTANQQSYALVKTLADGGFVVTWNLGPFTGRDQNHNVFGQRFDASGAAQGGEFQLNSFSSGIQNHPGLAAFADGGFVVTWSSYGQDGSGSGVYGQRFDANGVELGGEFRINTETNGNQFVSSVTALANGGFVMTWSSFGQDGSSYGICGQRYGADGAARGSEFQVNRAGTGIQRYSSVTGLDDGGFLIIWVTFGPDGGSEDIYGRRYDANGVALGTEFLVNETIAGDQTQDEYPRQSVTQLADGTIVITWRGTGQDTGDDAGVFARPRCRRSRQ